MQFRVLGPLDVRDGDRVLTPTAPKTATVLSMLLLRANHLALPEVLIEEIWGLSAPVSAASTLQTYIYHLRCSLGRDVIDTRLGGYVVPVDEENFDLLQFRAKVARAQTLLRTGRAPEARSELRESLLLWSGQPLSNLRAGTVMGPHLTALDEERRRAVELCVESEFALGRHREVIGELRMLVMSDPYNEWLHARLIEALSISGRRRDALVAYESLRKLLAEHLGLDPMRELQDLEQRVLAGGMAMSAFSSHVLNHSNEY